MTKREAAIVGAYTGIVLGKFEDLHKYIEEIMEGPILIHTLGREDVAEEIKKRSHNDFINIIVEDK